MTLGWRAEESEKVSACIESADEIIAAREFFSELDVSLSQNLEARTTLNPRNLISTRWVKAGMIDEL